MSGDAYEILRAEIVDGVLTSGTPLVEASIATRMGISRTPVREALRRLEQDGLVERKGRVVAVRSCSPEEILEIYAVRIVLEGLAARLAAEARNEFDLAQLGERHLKMKELGNEPTDHIGMALTNRRFHEALWTASHNRTLIDLLVRLNSHLSRYTATTLVSPGRWETVLADHQQLIEAITARDVERTASLAQSHMAAARDIRLRQYARGRPEPLI